MKINFKQPKYIVPLPLFAVFCLFFWAFKDFTKDRHPEKTAQQEEPGFNGQLPEVSNTVKDRPTTNKLDAYRNRYKDNVGGSAINAITPDEILDRDQKESQQYFEQLNSNNSSDEREVYTDRSNSTYKPSTKKISPQDEALTKALNNLRKASQGGADQADPSTQIGRQQSAAEYTEEQEQDPMELFKKQMSYADSIAKMNDPEYIAEQKRIKEQEQAEAELKDQPKLNVAKADKSPQIFNTVKREESKEFIKAIIDENTQGRAGSRIRLRLLEDINVGGHLVKKGSYIYSQITKFSEQRVGLSVVSIVKENKVLPVNLEVYDLDGMEGLYVPSSEFRDFTKQLGNRSIQGMNIQSSPENTSQFLMSSIQRFFSSTSTAIANIIRKNKAKLKYNTFIYLIDPQDLKEQQRNY